MFSKLVTTTHY